MKFSKNYSKMRLVSCIMVILTVNDVWCENTDKDSCVVTNATDSTLIRSYCADKIAIDEKIINNLSFMDSHFKVFPRIFDRFSNLHTVDIPNAGIEHIDSTTFENAGHLLTLDMYGNNLSILSNYIFSKASNLSTLDIVNNSIVTIENSAFDGLSNLRKLDLSYNQIKHLDAAIFITLHRLESIRLTNNKIEVINQDIFAHNVHLQFAYFSSNNILIVEPTSFIHTQLRSLDLGSNNLQNIDLQVETLTNFTTLTVANNHLNALNVPPSVEEIYAENNDISVIRSTEKNKLKKLFLSSNHLLDLQNLSNFGKLEFLDLSKNQFRTLEFSKLKNLVKLNELKLTGNTLTEINATDVDTNLPNLKMIELSTEHWPKAFVSKLSDELKDHKIILIPDRSELPDAGTTSQASSTTEKTTSLTTKIQTTTSNIPKTTSNIPTTTTATSKITKMPSPEPQPNSENVEKSLEKIVAQLNEMELANNAKYDALVSTFKTFEILLMIMFIAGLIFILFKIIVLSRNAFHNMRYRRAQSSDPLFSEQDL